MGQHSHKHWKKKKKQKKKEEEGLEVGRNAWPQAAGLDHRKEAEGKRRQVVEDHEEMKQMKQTVGVGEVRLAHPVVSCPY